MNRRQEIAAWIFGLVIALGLVATDNGIWALVVLASLTILSLRDRQKRRKSMNAAELFRTPEMDEKYAREAGLDITRRLYFQIIATADFDNSEQSEPARSRMIFEAEYFAVAHVIYHAGKWYSEEAQKRKFIDELKFGVALIAAVTVESSDKDEDAYRSAYESLLNLREKQYRTIRASFHSRLFRLFLGETFVDEVFLTERIKEALSEAKATVRPSALQHFVKRVVADAHNAIGTFPERTWREAIDYLREVRNTALWFGVVWLIVRIFRPEEAHHGAKSVAVLFLVYVVALSAKKFLNDKIASGFLAGCVVLAAVLLFVVPHHAVAEHGWFLANVYTPKTPLGKVLVILADAASIFVGFLTILSLCFFTTTGGAKRRWFVERFPFLAEVTWGLSEGIIPLLLLLTLAEIVWRLTA